MTLLIDQTERAATRHHLRTAARLALRGHGGAEPNPLVGCVIVDEAGDVVGEGYHRRCGEAHAEVIALRNAGERARGGTAYITLEPCNHNGRTGPCTEALIEAGIARVIIARRDPHPDAGGGAEFLRAAGVEVEVDESCREAIEASDPFVHRVRTGLPWVIAKWAQTLDGRIATRTGDSKWISGEASRCMVHRERGRVDAILTGIGTVLTDDPLLTARNVRIRRTARRIVIDPHLRIGLDAQLVRTASQTPCTIVCDESAIQQHEAKVESLHEAGVEVFVHPRDDGAFVMRDVLRALAQRHDLTNIMVEAGPGLMTSFMREKLINELWVFIGGKLLGDPTALPPIANDSNADSSQLTAATPLELRTIRRRDNDVILHYRTSRLYHAASALIS